jgi:hypothetical protein
LSQRRLIFVSSLSALVAVGCSFAAYSYWSDREMTRRHERFIDELVHSIAEDTPLYRKYLPEEDLEQVARNRDVFVAEYKVNRREELFSARMNIT